MRLFPLLVALTLLASPAHAEFRAAAAGVEATTKRLLSIGGTKSPGTFHGELGKGMWDECGMSRSRAGLERAMKAIPEIRARFWKDLRVTGTGAELNQTLEKAGRVADLPYGGPRRPAACGGAAGDGRSPPPPGLGR